MRFVSPFEQVNADDDNIDVHVELEDGRVFSIIVATPNNLIWCMDNEKTDYFFGTPAVYVRRLAPELIREALDAVVTENDGYWLEIYGALQE